MKKIMAALALVAGVALMAVGASQSASAAPAEKILICHATHADKNPYRVISVSGNANGFGHHAQHEGPLWTPGAETWGDVLPPVVVDGETVFPGQNWSGQSLVKGDPSTCFPVVVTTPPTTPPTTVPPTTPPTKKTTPPVVTPKLPDTGNDASIRLLFAGGLLALAGTGVLGGIGLAGRRD